MKKIHSYLYITQKQSNEKDQELIKCNYSKKNAHKNSL